MSTEVGLFCYSHRPPDPPRMLHRRLSTSLLALAARRARHHASVSFHVTPGALVTIDAASPVRVARGAEHDAVKATWTPSPPPALPVDTSQLDGRITLTFPRGAAIDVCVEVPGRYTSIDANTRGASFSLDRLAEADLAVDTAGGAVTIDSARCVQASIATAGGGVTVTSELQAFDLTVDTHGAPLTASKLAARSATLATHGGRVDVGALYGDAASIASAGGDVSVGTLHCADGATIDTAGGAATLDGVDGRATVATAGGPLHLHLLARAAAVLATTDGGEARVKLDASLVASTPAAGGVFFLAPAGMSLEDATAALQSTGVDASPPPPATPPPTGSGRVRDDSPATPPIIVVDARPNGAIHVEECSWFDAAVGRARSAADRRV